MIIKTNSPAYRAIRTKFLTTVPELASQSEVEEAFRNKMTESNARIRYYRTGDVPFYVTDCLGLRMDCDEIVVDDEYASWFLLKWL